MELDRENMRLKERNLQLEAALEQHRREKARNDDVFAKYGENLRELEV